MMAELSKMLGLLNQAQTMLKDMRTHELPARMTGVNSYGGAYGEKDLTTDECLWASQHYLRVHRKVMFTAEYVLEDVLTMLEDLDVESPESMDDDIDHGHAEVERQFNDYLQRWWPSKAEE